MLWINKYIIENDYDGSEKANYPLVLTSYLHLLIVSLTNQIIFQRIRMGFRIRNSHTAKNLGRTLNSNNKHPPLMAETQKVTSFKKNIRIPKVCCKLCMHVLYRYYSTSLNPSKRWPLSVSNKKCPCGNLHYIYPPYDMYLNAWLNKYYI